MTGTEWLKANWTKIRERAKTKTAAVSESGRCSYRADGDPSNVTPWNCCFIGYCLTPDEYRNVREGSLGSVALSENNIQVTKGESILINDVQGFHDNFSSFQWEDLLNRFELENPWVLGESNG